jgi:hypothetical protein
MIVLWAVACGGSDDDGGGAPDGAVTAPDAPTGVPDAPPAPDAAPLPDGPLPAPGTTCATAIDLAGAMGPEMQSTAMAGSNLTGASCAMVPSGPERYFVVDAGATPVDLVVDVLVAEGAAMPYDVVLSARADCAAPASELACRDAGWGERLEVRAATGPVSIIVDGSPQYGGLAQGDFTIEVRRRTIVAVGGACDPAGVASRCADGLRCDGTAHCAPSDAATSCAAAMDLTADLADGSAAVTMSVVSVDPDELGASCAFDPAGVHPERLVRFTTTGTRHLVASTDDPATTFDTVLVLRSADCTSEVACAGDVAPGQYRSRLDLPALPAGTYVLQVEAESDLVFGPPGTPTTAKVGLTLSAP